MATRDLTLADGRSLRIWDSGEPAGLTLLFHPGTPSGAEPLPEMADAAADLGLRLVAVARPGYAGSTRSPGRRVADVVADCAEVLEQLRVTTVVTVGASGGGPHALACAARLRGCRAAASLSGIGPWDVDGLDLLAGMAPVNVEEFTAALAGEQTLRPWLEAAAGAMTGTTPDALVEAMGELLAPADRDALTLDRAAFLARSIDEALAAGVDGWLDDDLAFTGPWGFDLAAITVPVAVWQGDADTMVPAAHGRWLAEHLPTARPHLVAGEGHLSLALGRMAEILGDLVALAD